MAKDIEYIFQYLENWLKLEYRLVEDEDGPDIYLSATSSKNGMIAITAFLLFILSVLSIPNLLLMDSVESTFSIETIIFFFYVLFVLFIIYTYFQILYKYLKINNSDFLSIGVLIFVSLSKFPDSTLVKISSDSLNVERIVELNHYSENEKAYYGPKLSDIDKESILDMNIVNYNPDFDLEVKYREKLHLEIFSLKFDFELPDKSKYNSPFRGSLVIYDEDGVIDIYSE